MKPYKKGYYAICNQGVRGSSPCGGTIFINKINNLIDKCVINKWISTPMRKKSGIPSVEFHVT